MRIFRSATQYPPIPRTRTRGRCCGRAKRRRYPPDYRKGCTGCRQRRRRSRRVRRLRYLGTDCRRRTASRLRPPLRPCRRRLRRCNPRRCRSRALFRLLPPRYPRRLRNPRPCRDCLLRSHRACIRCRLRRRCPPLADRSCTSRRGRSWE